MQKAVVIHIEFDPNTNPTYEDLAKQVSTVMHHYVLLGELSREIKSRPRLIMTDNIWVECVEFRTGEAGPFKG